MHDAMLRPKRWVQPVSASVLIALVTLAIVPPRASTEPLAPLGTLALLPPSPASAGVETAACVTLHLDRTSGVTRSLPCPRESLELVQGREPRPREDFAGSASVTGSIR